jgi:hypothetical protein
MPPTLDLDFDALAAATGLLPDDAAWDDAAVPLHERGVRLDWTIDFLKEVERQRTAIVERHASQQRASQYIDAVPWPAPLPAAATGELTGELVVEHVVKPLTAGSRAPFFARVPAAHRSRPAAFVSHAWTNPLIGGTAFTTLYAMAHAYRSAGPAPFVWVDFACYNQHRVEAIADDMRAVIGAIGSVALPMINAVPFSRLWCLWELLCAHVTGAKVDLWEANGSAHDLGFLARTFEEAFVSVERAATRLDADRRRILDAMVDAFGSIGEADRHLKRLVLDQLSKEADKPWNRPR